MADDKEENEGFRSDLKIIVIGTAGAGKTSFVGRWTKNQFNETYKATIMSEFGFKIYELDGVFYRIQLWDLAGQDQNSTITKVFAKDSHGVVIVTDCKESKSLDGALMWKQSVDDTARFMDGEALPCVIIQNKVDLLTEEEMKDDSAFKKFATDNGFLQSFRVSAKTGAGVNETMDYIIKEIVRRMDSLANTKGTDVYKSGRKNVVLQAEPSPAKGGAAGAGPAHKKKNGCC